jgi:flavodoxin
MKTLVVYHTRTGNTRFVAETIAAELGADIEEMTDLKNRRAQSAGLHLVGMLRVEEKLRSPKQKGTQLTMIS